MNMIKSGLTLAGTAALACTLAACNSGSSTSTSLPVVAGPTQYVQIERLARPAVKELFEKFVDHQTSNAAEPYNDPTLKAQIIGLTDALRPPKNGADYGVQLAGILYPDEYAVDVSQTGNASYLGVETGGFTGGTFGGRDIGDNVIDISLGAVFGNVLGPKPAGLGLQPEDNQENNCLTSQHVAQKANQAKTATFPYLSSPH